MSTVDISRFAHGLPKLLAPAVQEGQTFYAFLEKENSLTVGLQAGDSQHEP